MKEANKKQKKTVDRVSNNPSTAVEPASPCLPAWIDCDQEVEELEGSAPAAWFTKDGVYVRGLKPDGLLGNPVFIADALRCTGAAGRKLGRAPGTARLVAALVACAAASLASSSRL